ncbi:MAG: HAMP domain-containing sensor histidine kinase [Bifidobacterium sp.]
MSVTTIIGALVMTVGIILGSRHEFSERGISPDDVTSGILFNGTLVIDSEKALILVVLFVVGIIATTGIIAWFLARQEIRPLDEAMRLQRNFVADASHELKTPLAIIGARGELIKHRVEHGKDVGQALDELGNDIARMDGVINDLLVAAQDANSPRPVDMRRSIQEAVRALEVLANQRAIAIVLDVPESAITVMAGETGIVRCLVAILDNALAHSPEHSVIEVTAKEDKGMVNVTIRDHGVGMTGDPERYFARFARADTDSGQRGYGLGLALTRDVLSRYKGRISVVQFDGDGTAIMITLPTVSKKSRQ